MKEKDKKKVPQVTEEEVAAAGAGAADVAAGAGAADAAAGEASGAASAGAAGACECEKEGGSSAADVEAEVLDGESGAGAGSDSVNGADGATDAEDALAAAQAEVADLKDKYLRLHAEWDTYRRRTNEQRANEKALATEKLVNEILPVLDDFERTINYATENGEKGLLDGVRAVQTKLHGVLEKSGLEQLNPEGEAFDALQHQAVATVEDAQAFDETVHEVYQKGYKMGNKVLRPAMVTVTTGGPKRPAENEEEDAE